MTRDDCIWAAIRIFGVYLLVLSIIALPSFAMYALSAYTLLELRGAYVHETSTVEERNEGVLSAEQWDRVIGKELSRCVNSLLEVLVYSVVGVYFIKRGGFIFNMISKNGCPSGKPEESCE